MTEIWKSIYGYEDRYMISNKGRLKALERCIPVIHMGKKRVKHVKEIIMKPTKCIYGYLYAELTRNDGFKRKYKIHRLVALAFLENPKNKPVVNHIDFNTLNNKVSNLEWCTFQENSIHAVKNGHCADNSGENCGTSKLKINQVRDILCKYASGKFLQKDLAKTYGVDQSNISYIVSGSRWKKYLNANI